MTMKSGRSNEDKFLLSIVAVLLGLILCYSTCGKADIRADIRKEAIRQGVDPDVAVAIAIVESNLNPRALGKKGDIGLFQVMPYNSGGKNLWIVKNNVSIGIKLLKICKINTTTRAEAIVCYNNGLHRHPKYPELHPYYRKVVAALRNMY